MRRDSLSVAVIGGGIGGLTAGLLLLKAGLDVHVYEQSSRISEVGAGIAVSPNATRILYRWEWLYRHDPEAALTQMHRTDLQGNRNRDPGWHRTALRPEGRLFFYRGRLCRIGVATTPRSMR